MMREEDKARQGRGTKGQETSDLAVVRWAFVCGALSCAVLCVLCVSVVKSQNPARVLIVGDSISLGYGQFIADWLPKTYSVTRIPTNGGSSANLLAHAEAWIIRPQPNIIIVNAGIHDCTANGSRIGAQTTRDEYAQNMSRIIRKIKSDTDARLIVLTTTPLNEAITGSWPDVARNSEIDARNDILRTICAREGVELLDLNAVIRPRVAELTSDGIHRNAEGDRITAQFVADGILGTSR